MCGEGAVMVGVGNDEQFDRFCRVIGLTELLDEPAFKTNPLRIRHRQALRERIAERMKVHTAHHWVAVLSDTGIPAAPINDMRQMFEDPQVRHRDLVVTMPHGRGVDVPTLRSPLRMSRTQVSYRSPPILGAQTEEVLREVLGRTPAQIRALIEDGAVATASGTS